MARRHGRPEPALECHAARRPLSRDHAESTSHRAGGGRKRRRAGEASARITAGCRSGARGSRSSMQAGGTIGNAGRVESTTRPFAWSLPRQFSTDGSRAGAADSEMSTGSWMNLRGPESVRATPDGFDPNVNSRGCPKCARQAEPRQTLHPAGRVRTSLVQNGRGDYWDAARAACCFCSSARKACSFWAT